MKRLIRWQIVISIVLGIFGAMLAPEAVSAVSPEQPRSLVEGEQISRSYDKAWELYEQAGMESYFRDLAWLWNEPAKVRETLRLKLTVIDAESAGKLKALLIQILPQTPVEPEALLLAGKYHEANNQRETARWYYQQLLNLSPGYEPGLLALADQYLSNHQTDEAFQLIKGLESPEASLRKGVIYASQGRYQTALGYLIRAGAGVGNLEEIRAKELAKVFRAIGSITRVKTILGGLKPTTPIGTILFRELVLSIALLEGNNVEAENSLKEIRSIAPKYQNLNFYSAWAQQLQTGSIEEIGAMDLQLKSVIQLRQGQIYARQGKLDEAFRAVNDALKSDKRSVIGYLEAGALQMKRKKNDEALKLFSKGLEIDPKFIPLLAKRAELYQYLNLFVEADGDRAAIRLLAEEPPYLNVGQSRSETGMTYVMFHNDSINCLGIWFSEDAVSWSFNPWGRVTASRNATQVWVLPVGPGLSESAVRVSLNRPVIMKDLPIVKDSLMELKLPEKGQVVVEQLGVDSTGASFVSENVSDFHRIPLHYFNSGQQNVRIWFSTAGENWQAVVYQLAIPGQARIYPIDPLAMEKRNQAISLPQVQNFNYRLRFNRYRLNWTAADGVNSKIRIFSDDGSWSENAVERGANGFEANIPAESRFCQIVLTDPVGNISVFTDPGLNENLTVRAPVRFSINGGNPLTSSRLVTIEPGRSGLRYSFSNDLRSWSGWFEGDHGASWRISTRPGRQYVFVRYYFIGENGVEQEIRYGVGIVDYQP